MQRLRNLFRSLWSWSRSALWARALFLLAVFRKVLKKLMLWFKFKSCPCSVVFQNLLFRVLFRYDASERAIFKPTWQTGLWLNVSWWFEFDVTWPALSLQQDFSTQIAWWDKHRKECRVHGLKIGSRKFVDPRVAEFIAGAVVAGAVIWYVFPAISVRLTDELDEPGAGLRELQALRQAVWCTFTNQVWHVEETNDSRL